MYHSGKDLTTKIKAMLRKAHSLQTLEEAQEKGLSNIDGDLDFYEDVHKYLVEDIQALARDIANDRN